MATHRQVGMLTSFTLSMAVSASSVPRDIMLQLFVETNVKLGSVVMQEFVIRIHQAFIVSMILCLVAAGFSLVRGHEKRKIGVPGNR